MTTGVPDALFVVAAYTVILGALAVYALALVRRLRRAERALSGPGEPSEPDR